MLKLKTIQNFAFQNNLWQKGSKIVIGVSGGPDSACLLDILSVLAKKYEFELHIAHVNYSLRGKDSDGDENFARELGKKYGIKVSVFKPKKGQYKGNLENSLRNIRYDFFEKLRKELKFDLIAVAHNQDDQAETVLMRILRGSGLNGLSAIKAKKENIIRPLLGVSRKEIENYLKIKKLKYRIDKSNKDPKFMRNRIRHKLLPYLEKEFNPTVKQTLASWSFSVAQDYDFVEKEAEKFVGFACRNKCIHFRVQDFLDLHDAIQRQVVRQFYQKLKNSTLDIESKQIEEVIKVIKSTKSKSPKALIGGLNISKKGGNIDMFC